MGLNLFDYIATLKQYQTEVKHRMLINNKTCIVGYMPSVGSFSPPRVNGVSPGRHERSSNRPSPRGAPDPRVAYPSHQPYDALHSPSSYNSITPSSQTSLSQHSLSQHSIYATPPSKDYSKTHRGQSEVRGQTEPSGARR